MSAFRWISIALFGVLPASATLPLDVVLCQLPTEATPDPVAHGLRPADYGAGARLVRLSPDGRVEPLSEGFASACDPDVSFDGERLLFAAQKNEGDPWSIWESRIDGSEARQITPGTPSARQPIYLSSLYTITSSEPWYVVAFVGDDRTWNESGTAPATSLYTVRLDGGELRRITFNPGVESSPLLMSDGLLVFSSWKGRATERWPEGRSALYGVQPDGIDYHLYGGLPGSRLQHMPTQAGERVYFVEADAWPWDGAGRLARLARRRPLHDYRTVGIEGDHLWHSPSALPDGTLLVSRRPADGTGSLDLVHLDPDTGRAEPLLSSADYHEMHARLLAPRPEPDGRSSTVRTEFDTGKLYGLDVYESQDALDGVERGTVERLRVHYASRAPAREPGGLGELEIEVLGEAKVEEDGSFHFDLPADLPVRIEALDADGETLATCDWIWVRQREFRGCIGCHEDGERTPESSIYQAAIREAETIGLDSEGRAAVRWLQPAHGSGGEAPPGETP